MAEVVCKCGIKREKGYLYFVNKKGDCARVAMARAGKKSSKKQEVMHKCGKEKDGLLVLRGQEGQRRHGQDGQGRTQEEITTSREGKFKRPGEMEGVYDAQSVPPGARAALRQRHASPEPDRQDREGERRDAARCRLRAGDLVHWEESQVQGRYPRDGCKGVVCARRPAV